MEEIEQPNLDTEFEQLLQIAEAIDIEEELARIAEQSMIELKNDTMMPIFDEFYGGKVVEEAIGMKGAKKPIRDPKGGLTAAGRAYFKRTEGANLKPGVRGPANTPEKMRRKGSFLTRFFTNPSGPMVDEKGRATRLALSAAAWGEPVPKNMQDAAKLAAKGRRLLERYAKTKKKSADLDIVVKSVFSTVVQTNEITYDEDLNGLGGVPSWQEFTREGFVEAEDRAEIRRLTAMLSPSFIKGEKMFVDDEQAINRLNKASKQMAKARKKKKKIKTS